MKSAPFASIVKTLIIFVKGNIDATDDIIFRISPNIVYDQPVMFSIGTYHKQSFTWMILDPFGNVFEQGNINGEQKHTEISIDTSNLGSGMYTVVTDMYGGVGRFVKF